MKTYKSNDYSDPIHYVVKTKPDEMVPTGWYFWDEVWFKRLGPYASYYTAQEALKKYAEDL